MKRKAAQQTMEALSFDQFWEWLKNHGDCLLQVMGQESLLIDQYDFHWRLYDIDDIRVIELRRGKDVVAEIGLLSPLIDKVVGAENSEEDFTWDLLADDGETVVYRITMNHGYEKDEDIRSSKLLH